MKVQQIIWLSEEQFTRLLQLKKEYMEKYKVNDLATNSFIVMLIEQILQYDIDDIFIAKALEVKEQELVQLNTKLAELQQTKENIQKFIHEKLDFAKLYVNTQLNKENIPAEIKEKIIKIIDKVLKYEQM